jgi:DNA polymerase I-like protein with 3'-5' exonuclease and polymerase domains
MTTKNYGLLDTVDSLKTYVKKVIDGGRDFAFDIEAGYTGPDAKDISKMPFHPTWLMVGFSFTDDTSWARYVPVAHDNGQNVNQVAAARLLWTLLQTGRGVPHNAMYELQGLSRWFREVLWDDTFFATAVRATNGLYPVLSDTMIEANMVQRYQPLASGVGVGVGLKGLTKHIFGHQMTEFMDLFPEEESELGPGTPKSKRSTVRFNTRNLVPQVVEYACEDSAWTLALHEHHHPEVKDRLMFKTEILLLPVLCEMEQEGLALDWAEYDRRSTEITGFKAALNEEIQSDLSERLGELVSVNFNSPKQVQELLYEKLELPIQYNRKTAKPTTDEKAMQVLARKDPSLNKILEWRGVSKLLSSYIDKYRNELSYDLSGRARPNHNQLGAGTGRFSVDGVSYQQWPKPYHFELKDGTALDLNYRNFLVAPDGFRIVGFDFSQVELRVLAGMANETALLQAFADGTDIHKATASTMLGIPLEELTEKDRAKGKTLNFAIVYGSGAQAIGEALGITTEEAEALLAQYFETFSGLKTWMDARVIEGQTTWEVSTMFGRRFHIWEYNEYDRLLERASRLSGDERKDIEKWARNMRSKGDRMCVNAPVQGGAADYLKLGMVRAQRAIKAAGLQDKIRLVMTIHDALEFYVHESVSTQEVIDLLNPMVSFPVEGLPEILAEWHEGRKWGDVVEVNVDANKNIVNYEWKKQKFATVEEAYAFQDKYPNFDPKKGIPTEEPERVEEPEPIVSTQPSSEYYIEFVSPPTAEEWLRAKDIIVQCESPTGTRLTVEIAGQKKTLGGLYAITSTPMDLIQSALSTGTLELRAVEA